MQDRAAGDDQHRQRARCHRALGDVHRLTIVDALRLSDRAPVELQRITGLPSNLLTFHLGVLEDAGLVSRHRSRGDGRRRYVTLEPDALASVETTSGASIGLDGGPVLFVCTGNSTRSPLAAALWTDRTGRDAASAGSHPARCVGRHTVEVARRHGLDLAGARPRGYGEVRVRPGLVVSVCDRAREAGPPFDAPLLHWSVPDPSGGGLAGVERIFADLRRRVDRLADAVAG